MYSRVSAAEIYFCRKTSWQWKLNMYRSFFYFYFYWVILITEDVWSCRGTSVKYLTIRITNVLHGKSCWIKTSYNNDEDNILMSRKYITFLVINGIHVLMGLICVICMWQKQEHKVLQCCWNIMSSCYILLVWNSASHDVCCTCFSREIMLPPRCLVFWL